MVKANYKKIPQYLLIEMAQNDDFKALEELIKRIQKEIFAIFSHLCSKRELVADLTQETLVKIMNLEEIDNVEQQIEGLTAIIKEVLTNNRDNRN